jgi:alpha-mannosidase
MNRKAEHLLKTAEQVAVLTRDRQQAVVLRKIWEDYLIIHFHDVLPGTSTGTVYQDVRAILQRTITSCQNHIRGFIRGTAQREKGTVAVFNPHGQAFSGRVQVGKQWQRLEAIPAFSVTPVRIESVHDRRVRTTVLTNRYWQVTVDPRTGWFNSILDKQQRREVLKGKANVVTAFEDSGSAWDIEPYHARKIRQQGIAVHKAAFYRNREYMKCVITGQIMSSPIKQGIYLFKNDPVIYIDCEVDWHERKTVLKSINSVQVQTDEATYGIQGATITRPVHRNTLYDHSRFEVPAEGWMDLSETGYGVSLISDAKYGFSARPYTMGLSLLRSSVAPDGNADQGLNTFSYALYPHKGDWRQADTPGVSRHFALGVEVLPGFKGRLGSAIRVKDTDPGRINHFIVDTLKYAESGKGIILRGYETKGSRGKVLLKPDFIKLKKAWLCNLLEEEEKNLPVLKDGTISVAYKPYELITIKAF